MRRAQPHGFLNHQDPLTDFSAAEKWPSFLLQIGGNQRELIQGRLQVFHNLCRNHVGIGQVGGIFQALVLEPKDVKAPFVALCQFLITEALEALARFPLVATFRVVALHKIVEVGALQRIGLEGEVLVGAKVVDPERAIMSDPKFQSF